MSTPQHRRRPRRNPADDRRQAPPSQRDTRPVKPKPAPHIVDVDDTNGFVKCGVPKRMAGVLAATGVTEPFSIQTVTLPDSLAGRDVLGQGRTGSGKTIAFALPLVARLADDAKQPRTGRPRGLVLVPTRELATQVAGVIDPLARAMGMRVMTVFGGVGFGPQRDGLSRGTEIVVACPGRLVDLMGEGDARLDAIEVTVIDEADHMADQGFLPMVTRILDATPKKGQRMLFSATLAGGVDSIVTKYLHDPVSHAAEVEAPVLLDHHVMVIDDADRLAAVAELAKNERAVIFTRTKWRAKQMAVKLKQYGITAVDMHGNLSQTVREKNLAAFADGTASAMVATDIAARGIHVDEVPLVIHADPPVEHKAYLHRSGRTARAGAAGRVVTVTSLAQVGEVRDLLRKAGVTTAQWEGIEVPESVRNMPDRGRNQTAKTRSGTPGKGRRAQQREQRGRSSSGGQHRR